MVTAVKSWRGQDTSGVYTSRSNPKWNYADAKAVDACHRMQEAGGGPHNQGDSPGENAPVGLGGMHHKQVWLRQAAGRCPGQVLHDKPKIAPIGLAEASPTLDETQRRGGGLCARP